MPNDQKFLAELARSPAARRLLESDEIARIERRKNARTRLEALAHGEAQFGETIAAAGAELESLIRAHKAADDQFRQCAAALHRARAAVEKLHSEWADQQDRARLDAPAEEGRGAFEKRLGAHLRQRSPKYIDEFVKAQGDLLECERTNDAAETVRREAGAEVHIVQVKIRSLQEKRRLEQSNLKHAVLNEGNPRLRELLVKRVNDEIERIGRTQQREDVKYDRNITPPRIMEVYSSRPSIFARKEFLMRVLFHLSNDLFAMTARLVDDSDAGLENFMKAIFSAAPSEEAMVLIPLDLPQPRGMHVTIDREVAKAVAAAPKFLESYFTTQNTLEQQ